MQEGMLDPLTGFTYPEEWVARCRDPVALREVRRGLAVLTSSGRVLKRGYTTGTTAAAACKAAVISLERTLDCVEVLIPAGIRVLVPVKAKEGIASCRKHAGDHPSDVTAGMEFVARAEAGEGGIAFSAGRGIGRHARRTPRYAPGSPAISPPALHSIMQAIHEGMGEIGLPGVRIELSAPEGAGIAEKTLNPRMGVVGGISVLGTTGLVEPWGDHLIDSALERIAGAVHPVLTTGRTGMRCSRMLFPDREVILIGSKLRESLSRLGEGGVLCGLPGIILRFSYPDILEGTGCTTVEELIISGAHGSRVSEAIRRFRESYPGVRLLLVDRQCRVLEDTG